MRRYLLVSIPIFLAIVIFIYTKTWLNFIDKDLHQHYVLLIRSQGTLSKSSTSTSDFQLGQVENQKTQNINITPRTYLIFYWYPKNYFLLFSINDNLFIREQGSLIRLSDGSDFQVRQRIQETYGFNVDFTASFTSAESEALLKLLGGTTYFNIYSNALEKGEVYVEPGNYDAFLNGIENSFRREDARKGIWLSLLEKQRTKIALKPAFKKLKQQLYRNLQLNINYGTFLAISNPLFENQNADKELYVRELRANQTTINDPLLGEVAVPFENGKYDALRIKEVLTDYKTDLPKAQLFPIVMQIRNTTTINRLAVRTAGVLRLKKIDALEYLNSTIKLENSVLLNYAHSPIKTRYVKRHTKINVMYKMFDYREDFDFALYIAPDYYAVKLFQQ